MDNWTKKDFENERKYWGNSTLAGWELVYEDETIISSRDTKFEDAPQHGIIFLIKWYKKPNGTYSKEVQNGLDFYILLSNVAESLQIPKQVKLGRNIERSKFDDMLKKARARSEPVTEMI